VKRICAKISLGKNLGMRVQDWIDE